MTISEQINAYLHRHDGQVQLQGVGWRDAKKACEFKVGDVMLCNFGHEQEVVDVKPCGKTMVHLFVRCGNGNVYDKRCKLDTLYACKK